MDSSITINMVRETIKNTVSKHKGDLKPIAIFPFGKDGMIVKFILNNQFGIVEKYLVDNGMCRYNPAIIPSSKLTEIDEDIVVIVSTKDKSINDLIIKELEELSNPHISVINIVEPIIYPIKIKSEYFDELKKLLHVMPVKDREFTRIGRLNDGGYAMVNDFSDDMIAYSFGISDDMSWDIQINEMSGMKVNMFDHTIPCAPGFHKGCCFHRLGIGPVDDEINNLLSLETIVSGDGMRESHGKLIMKMDIEDAEWDVLDSVPEGILRCFRQMVFEFHGMTEEDKERSEKRLRVLRKLNRTHQVVWVHGNNFTHALGDDEMTIPYAIEVLYLNRECYEFSSKKANLPLSIDMPNMPGRKDFDLSFFTR